MKKQAYLTALPDHSSTYMYKRQINVLMFWQIREPHFSKSCARTTENGTTLCHNSSLCATTLYVTSCGIKLSHFQWSQYFHFFQTFCLHQTYFPPLCNLCIYRKSWLPSRRVDFTQNCLKCIKGVLMYSYETSLCMLVIHLLFYCFSLLPVATSLQSGPVGICL